MWHSSRRRLPKGQSTAQASASIAVHLGTNVLNRRDIPVKTGGCVYNRVRNVFTYSSSESFMLPKRDGMNQIRIKEKRRWGDPQGEAIKNNEKNISPNLIYIYDRRFPKLVSLTLIWAMLSKVLYFLCLLPLVLVEKKQVKRKQTKKSGVPLRSHLWTTR